MNECQNVVLGSLFISWLAYTVRNSRKARLDHIPGPFLARYTDAWRCFRAWKQLNRAKHDSENYQMQGIREYGDVIRVGPTNVVVLDPEAIPVIYGFKERLNKVCSVPSLRVKVARVLLN